MSEDKQEAGGEAAPAGRRKRPLLAAGGLGVVSILAAAAWFLHLGPFGRHHPSGHAAAQPVEVHAPVYVETPEMMSNLDAGPHRIAFAKMQCRIEVARPADAALVTAAMPQIVDMAETYLRAVTPEELRSATGAYLLREALLGRLAIAVPGAPVTDVLFEELLVQ